MVYDENDDDDNDDNDGDDDNYATVYFVLSFHSYSIIHALALW